MYELFVFLSLNSNFQYFHAKSSNFTTQTKVSPTAALNVIGDIGGSACQTIIKHYVKV